MSRSRLLRVVGSSTTGGIDGAGAGAVRATGSATGWLGVAMWWPGVAT